MTTWRCGLPSMRACPLENRRVRLGSRCGTKPPYGANARRRTWKAPVPHDRGASTEQCRLDDTGYDSRKAAGTITFGTPSLSRCLETGGGPWSERGPAGRGPTKSANHVCRMIRASSSAGRCSRSCSGLGVRPIRPLRRPSSWHLGGGRTTRSRSRPAPKALGA